MNAQKGGYWFTGFITLPIPSPMWQEVGQPHSIATPLGKDITGPFRIANPLDFLEAMKRFDSV